MVRVRLFYKPWQLWSPVAGGSSKAVVKRLPVLSSPLEWDKCPDSVLGDMVPFLIIHSHMVLRFFSLICFWEKGEKYVLRKQISAIIRCWLLLILLPFPVFVFFFRQLISLCKFQRVQIVNVLNVLYFLKRGHWSCRDCVQSTAGVPQTLRSRVTKLFLDEDAGLLTLVCNLKKQNKTNRNKTVAARLGDDFEMGQSSNEFIYRFREEHTSWRVTIAKWDPAAKISNFLQKIQEQKNFFKALVLFICGLSTLVYWFHTSRCLLL